MRNSLVDWSRMFIGILLASATSLSAQDGIRHFDFGPDGSPVWPGFQLVTEKMAYTKEQGFGVGSKGAITAVLNVNPDDLCRDFLVTANGEPLEFSLDAPNGEYTVCVISGDDFSRSTWQRPSTYLDQEVRILADGKEVYRKKRPGLFYLQDKDYTPGEDMYDKYFKERYIDCVFNVTVTGGRLILSFEPLTPPFFEAFPVNAVMVYPRLSAGQLEKDLASVEKTRRDSFSKRWPRNKSLMGTPGIEVTATELKRGYQVFPVDYQRTVYPETEPGTDDTVKQMETFAAQGEREPLSFCVRALKPLKSVKIEVSDLSSDGATISHSNIDVSVVRHIESPYGSGLIGNCKSYWVRPYTLMNKWAQIDIPQNLTKQYILEIKTPKGALPGIYNGIIAVNPDNAPSFEFPFRLRVLPFQLDRSPYAVAFLMGDSEGMRHGIAGAEKEGFFRKDSDLLRRYGFVQSPRLADWLIKIEIDQQKRTLSNIDFSNYDKMIELYAKNGMLPRDGFVMFALSSVAQRLGIVKWIQQFVPITRLEITHSDDQRDLALLKEIALRIDAHIRGKGLIPVFEFGGELSNYTKDNQGLEFGRWGYGMLRGAGVQTALCGNGAYEITLAKEGLIDYMIPNGALLRDAQTEIIRKNCKGMWLYNFSEGRYGYGFFAWKKGATRRLHEGLVKWWGIPWNDFCVGEGNWPIGAEQGKEGLVSQIRLIWISEGIDDYDYLATCEAWIKKAEAAGKPEVTLVAAHAKETLKLLASQTFSDYNFLGERAEASVANINRDGCCRWALGDFQKYRWLVALEIMRLQKAMEPVGENEGVLL